MKCDDPVIFLIQSDFSQLMQGFRKYEDYFNHYLNPHSYIEVISDGFLRFFASPSIFEKIMVSTPKMDFPPEKKEEFKEILIDMTGGSDFPMVPLQGCTISITLMSQHCLGDEKKIIRLMKEYFQVLTLEVAHHVEIAIAQEFRHDAEFASSRLLFRLRTPEEMLAFISNFFKQLYYQFEQRE